MEPLEFKIIIDAPREVVWNILIGVDTYPIWTSVFCEGSKVETDWKVGSKALFLDGNNSGMVSVIEENTRYSFLSIKHIGEVKNGSEDLESEQVKSWAGCHENYTLKDLHNNTLWIVEMDVTPESAEQVKVMMRKSLTNAYGDSAIRKSAELTSALYPGKAVKEGDSWSAENSGGNNIMTPKVKGVYTLDKISGSEYLISNKSTIEVKNSADAVEMNNFSMKYAVSGTMTSNSKVDKKKGMIMEMKALQNISGVIMLKTSASPEEIEMPIKATNNITMTTTFVK